MERIKIIVMSLFSIIGCNEPKKEEAKNEVVKVQEISINDIQELIDFITAKGYKIKVLPPKIIGENALYGVGYGYIGDKETYFNRVLSDISFRENASSSSIYNYLSQVKNTIIEKDQYLEGLKPNPIIKELKNVEF